MENQKTTHLGSKPQSTKKALLSIFSLCVFILVVGHITISSWLLVTFYDLSYEEVFRQAVVSLFPMQIVFAGIVSMLFLYVVERYITIPIETLHRDVVKSHLNRDSARFDQDSLNHECNLIAGTLNGLFETLNYADQLASNSEIVADNLHAVIEDYQRLCGFKDKRYLAQVESLTPEQRLHIVNHLAMSMSLDHMHIVFLPQIDRATGEVVSMDALLRWEDPLLGTLDPLIFLSIAEECGLIVKLTTLSIHHVAEALACWGCVADSSGMTISINLSRKQFYDPKLISRIERACDHHQIKPSQLALEVSEPILNVHLSEAYVIAERLHKLGVNLTVDHYKAEFLSTYDFQRLMINKIKLDHRFSYLDDTHKAKALLNQLIEIGNETEVSIVAVGIETEEQLSFWHQFSGDLLMQGFYFSKTVDQHAAKALLNYNYGNCHAR